LGWAIAAGCRALGSADAGGHDSLDSVGGLKCINYYISFNFYFGG
jgi:hypothetical protein